MQVRPEQPIPPLIGSTQPTSLTEVLEETVHQCLARSRHNNRARAGPSETDHVGISGSRSVIRSVD